METDMDRREILPEGTLLDFPGMPCTVGPLVGRGANAIVYLGSYPDRQQPDLHHRVLIKELFPFHERGAIYRDGRGCICIRPEGDAADSMRLHRATFNRGNEVHIRLLGEHPGDLDPNINTFSLHDTLYTVLGFSGGRTLDRALDVPQRDRIRLSTHVRRILGVLEVLDAFHGSGYLHLDISPDNILLIGDGRKERIGLIDYNSVYTLDEIRDGRVSYYSIKEGYTPFEIRQQKIGRIGYHTDLYALTAVFYFCLTGRVLDQMQMTHCKVPDLSGAGCLEDMPDTVVSKVRQVLGRGLALAVRRRYEDAAAMRMDLEELQDRIDGRGITHWALWETGRAGMLRTVRTNPALSYIRDGEQVYPIVGTQADGTRITLEELFHSLTAHGGRSAVLLGSGGMGKTTALLRMAYLQPPKYSRAEPALFYMSLYGWKDGGSDHVKNKILEGLKFRPETDSMETAKHELIRLFSSPLYTPWGDRPQCVLLLDGLNEASGGVGLLEQEIVELSKLPGLRILLTARTLTEGISFAQIRLRQLERKEVRDILSGQGILPPEEEDLFQLLRTPMMLSIFVRTVLDGGKQMAAGSREQLLAGYFSALLEKEKKNAPEDAAVRWRIDAAVYYVLPQMAGFMSRKGTALADQELLPLIRKCFRRLQKHDMTIVFPQWIGHLSDIRGGAQNAEEWYGLMVHGILWRKLGLIICDESGKYKIVHQIIGEYLAQTGRVYERRFVRRQRIRACLVFLLFSVLAGSVWKWAYLPYRAAHPAKEVEVHYDEALADNVLGTAFTSYVYAAQQYESVIKVLEYLQGESIDENTYEHCLSEIGEILASTSADHTQRALRYVEDMQMTGEVMPWSEEPLDEAAYRDLVAIPVDRAKEYGKYVGILERLREDQELWGTFGESYVEAFAQAVTCDAYVTGKNYKILIEPEVDAMDGHLYESASAGHPEQNEITEACDRYTLEQYQRDRIRAWREFRSNAAISLVGEKG